MITLGALMLTGRIQTQVRWFDSMFPLSLYFLVPLVQWSYMAIDCHWYAGLSTWLLSCSPGLLGVERRSTILFRRHSRSGLVLKDILWLRSCTNTFSFLWYDNKLNCSLELHRNRSSGLFLTEMIAWMRHSLGPSELCDINQLLTKAKVRDIVFGTIPFLLLMKQWLPLLLVSLINSERKKGVPRTGVVFSLLFSHAMYIYTDTQQEHC